MLVWLAAKGSVLVSWAPFLLAFALVGLFIWAMVKGIAYLGKGVPFEVLHAFKGRFPTEAPDHWKQLGDGSWEVEFYKNDRLHLAYFNGKGLYDRSKTKIYKNELPDTILNKVDCQLNGGNIIGAYRVTIEKPSKKHYEVIIKASGKLEKTIYYES